MENEPEAPVTRKSCSGQSNQRTRNSGRVLHEVTRVFFPVPPYCKAGGLFSRMQVI